MDRHQFREWLVRQKFTLGRGYSWANIPALSIVVVSAVKTILPGLINTFWKTVLVAVIGLFGLWFLGWLDKRYRFLHEEQIYQTETNPALWEVVQASRENKKENGTKTKA